MKDPQYRALVENNWIFWLQNKGLAHMSIYSQTSKYISTIVLDNEKL